MNIFHQMLTLQLQLFLLMALGLFLKRIGLIDTHGRKLLSTLLINVVLPCIIFRSFQSGDISPELINNFIVVVVVSAGIQLCAILGSALLFRRYPKQQKAPMGYGMLCPNSSFVGMPINAALYGSLGIIYTALLEIPMNLTMWTVGLGMFTSMDHRSAVKKVLLHPCIIAVFLGLISMFLSLTLPAVLDSAVLSVGQCATPLSMIVIGATLADADFKMIFSRRVLWFSLLRLLLFPLAVYAVLSLLPLDPVLVAITVIVTGTPAGSTTSILAEQYDCGSEFASQIVFSSMLLSLVTLPLLALLF